MNWIVFAAEILMVLVFIYWFILQLSGKTEFPRWMAFTNVLFIYVLMRVVLSFIPVSPFRLGFANGLMSESMFIWFAIMLVREISGTSN